MAPEANPGGVTLMPMPLFWKICRLKTRFSTRIPKVSVTRATYRLPSLIVRNPISTPNGMATSPPTTTPAITGHPWSTARIAMVIPPAPAQVDWQSQIMPPSPVTRVNDR